MSDHLKLDSEDARFPKFARRKGAKGEPRKNADCATVAGFGKEWRRFHYGGKQENETHTLYESYFGWLGESFLDVGWVVADFGCGSGRWAALVASKVAEIWCIDASPEALESARANLPSCRCCHVVNNIIGNMSIPDNKFDFGYSLGVLHHVPEPEAGLRDCVRTLKSGAPFLLYLYYAMDNRPVWYRMLWSFSNAGRKAISRFPYPLKLIVCEVLAVLVYWPLARASKVGKRAGFNVSDWPLSFYRDCSLYVMRNDALDRFGTPLEMRFTKAEIHSLMERCGLRDIRFKSEAPYWVAVGRKA